LIERGQHCHRRSARRSWQCSGWLSETKWGPTAPRPPAFREIKSATPPLARRVPGDKTCSRRRQLCVRYAATSSLPTIRRPLRSRRWL
jgi:hypothetical protein